MVPSPDFTARAVEHWDALARRRAGRGALAGYYHRRLAEVYRALVGPGRRVLELGCGRGDLLAALAPAVGVGIDFSGEMLRQARRRHPALRFLQADAHQLPLDEAFDVVILSDLVNNLWDVQGVLAEVRRLCTPRTRVILNFYSRVWDLPLRLARASGLAEPLPEQNWLTVDDVSGLLRLTGFEPIRRWHEVLWPVRTPGVDALANRVLVRFWPLNHLALANFLIARPAPQGGTADLPATPPLVSVVVPARNEEGNIPAILRRVPELGAGTELVFVEGGSTDGTLEAIEQSVAASQRRCRVLRQTGRGKGDAVRLGFAAAAGDMFMILDADLTVAPEDLPRFYEALLSRQAEFVNGVRLVYPLEPEAMRFGNLLANKFFSLAFSWLLGQPIKDTLCGTKALWREDYARMAAGRAYFGDFDPFGDFDLLFGAARLNLKLVDLPVRYGSRTYGASNIHRARDGWRLLRMLGVAARRLKFV